MNMIKTAMLIAFMTALFMGIGFMIGGTTGMAIAFVVAAAMNLFSYWNADKMVLSMHHAQEVDARSAPEYYRIVQGLAANAGLPMPKVYVIQNAQPNAFATGRNPDNAAVAATTGLLERLTPEEVAGVMAHELAHVQNRDTLIMTITATLAGAISMLGNFAFFFGGNRDNNNPFGFIGVLVAMLVAPFAAMLVQMAISRTREYSADRRGAEICGNPSWLASALGKIAVAAGRTVNHDAERNPATAHMFIINPLSGQRMDSLFSTHPDTENRIAALRELSVEMGVGSGSARMAQPNADRRHESGASLSDSAAGHAEGPWGRRRNAASQGQSPRSGPWSRGASRGDEVVSGDDRGRHDGSDDERRGRDARGPWGPRSGPKAGPRGAGPRG